MQFPWLLDSQSKSDIIFIDSREKMKGEIDKEILTNLFHANLNQNFAYLTLEVHRDRIIEDTLNSLVREDLNFRKPLKVKFVGELGVDEGGVQKEFF
jgi:ubiquitin-protein ligase E3 A